MIPSRPVVYVIVCGAPAADGVYAFVIRLQEAGWCVCVIATPSGARFVDVDRLVSLTGYPVRTEYKAPEDPDVLPPADVCVVAPATFNTINKIANGITDTLAVGLVCEALGYGRPVVVVPWFNRGLAGHGAYERSLAQMGADGARVILTPRTEPGAELPDRHEDFPWDALLEVVARRGPG